MAVALDSKKALDVRIAATHLLNSLHHPDEFEDLIEEILRNPAITKSEPFTNRVISFLQNNCVPELLMTFPKCARAFFDKVVTFAGSDALGLNKMVTFRSLNSTFEVSRRMLELHCPFLARNVTHTFSDEISEEALREITEYIEKDVINFSPENILEVRKFANCWKFENLLWTTESFIGGLVRQPTNGPPQFDQLFKTWVFAHETDDGLLKSLLLFEHTPNELPTRFPVSTLHEIEAWNSLLLSHQSVNIDEDSKWDFSNGRLTVNSSPFSHFIIDRMIKDHYTFHTLNYECHSNEEAAEFARILRGHGAACPFRKFSLETESDEVISILIPTIIKVTKVSEIRIEPIFNHVDFVQIGEALESNTFLEKFEIENTRSISLQGARALAKALSQNKTLKELLIPGYELEPEDYLDSESVRTIGSAFLQNHTVKHFNSNILDLDLKGLEVWIQVLGKNTGLEKLSLTIKKDCFHNMGALGKVFESNKFLQELTLNIDEGQPELYLLFEGLAKCQNLRTLTVFVDHEENRPPVFKVKPIVTFLEKTTSLKSFDLRMTFEEDQIEVFMDGLQKNRSLHSLGLHHAKIVGTHAGKFLAAVLKTHPLRYLNINDIELQDDDLKFLAHSLKENTTLRTLLLDSKCSLETYLDFASSLASNSTLLRLNFIKDTFNRTTPQELIDKFSNVRFESYRPFIFERKL